MKYESKEKYELKLDSIKNTPTPNKSQRKQELLNYEIKSSSKKEWLIACEEADEAMSLDRATRIEKLTFHYILDKQPKSSVKKEVIKDEVIEKVTPTTSKSTTKTKSTTKSTTKKTATSASTTTTNTPSSTTKKT